MNNNINIADTTGRVYMKNLPTKSTPDMEQLYFEFQDNTHTFQIGLKTILECILFGEEKGQLPELPFVWYNEVCNRYDISLSEILGED